MKDSNSSITAGGADNLDRAIEALPKEMLPEKDLWAGIERAIEFQQSPQQPATRNNKVFALAASVCAAVLLGWYTFVPNEQVVPNTLLADSNSAVQAIEQVYALEKQALLVSFGKPDLSQLPANLKVQFDELNNAKASLKKALASDPNNPELLNLLAWLQRQELALLEQLYSPRWHSI